MLRLTYLSTLYWWYGGSLSTLSEKLAPESSGENKHDSSSSVSEADHASEANGPSQRRNSTSPAPASGSQVAQDPSRRATAVALGNAERAVQSNAENAQSMSGGERGSDELRRLVKRVSILEKLTALTVLTSIVSDMDLFADWYFFREGLVGESPFVYDIALAFTVLGTIMYVLVTVEFHLVSMAWTVCRGGKPLNPLQHVPLGWQLLLNVGFEDAPQLIITCVTSPTSVAGVLNIATAGFALLTKMAEGFATRHDLPMSAQLRMVEEDPGVVRHMVVRQREAEELAAKAASLAVLVNQFRQVPDSHHRAANRRETKRREEIAFEVMRLDPGFLNGKLEHIREKLEISKLDFVESQLKGPIPPALGSLTGLQELSLPYNWLVGPVPSELGRLSRLTELNLSDNYLEGTIPPVLGNLSALTNLNLSGNKLSGAIPTELGSLSKLEGLSLSSNVLDGPIPPELSGLTTLRHLSLGDNQLTGTIPRELGGLTAVQALYLRNNQLTGSVPVGRLRALSLAFFYGNKFSGTKEEVERLLPEGCEVLWSPQTR